MFMASGLCIREPRSELNKESNITALERELEKHWCATKSLQQVVKHTGKSPIPGIYDPAGQA